MAPRAKNRTSPPDSTAESLREARSMLEERVRDRPYASLGIAVAAGVLLGGGLTPRILATTARVGARLAVGSFLEDALRRGLVVASNTVASR